MSSIERLKQFEQIQIQSTCTPTKNDGSYRAFGWLAQHSQSGADYRCPTLRTFPDFESAQKWLRSTAKRLGMQVSSAGNSIFITEQLQVQS